MSGEQTLGRTLSVRKAEGGTWCQCCKPNDANEVNDATTCIVLGGPAIVTYLYLCDGCCRAVGEVAVPK